MGWAMRSGLVGGCRAAPYLLIATSRPLPTLLANFLGSAQQLRRARRGGGRRGGGAPAPAWAPLPTHHGSGLMEGATPACAALPPFAVCCASSRLLGARASLARRTLSPAEGRSGYSPYLSDAGHAAGGLLCRDAAVGCRLQPAEAVAPASHQVSRCCCLIPPATCKLERHRLRNSPVNGWSSENRLCIRPVRYAQTRLYKSTCANCTPRTSGGL